MIPGGGKPATALQVAMFGHIAATIRAAMQTKGIQRPGDLNEMIGRGRDHPGIYQYMNGKAAPSPDGRTRLAEALGVPESALQRRDPPTPRVEAAQSPEALVRLSSPGRTVVERIPEVLQFAVLSDGSARLKLDLVMPAERGVALLQILLSAGVVLSDTRE